MLDINAGLGVVFGAGLFFAFMNGLNDSATVAATVIASRAMAPRQALLVAALGELAGPFILGTAVASTVGRGLVSSATITPPVLLAALAAAAMWQLVACYTGLPTSSSHALVGGLTGAALAAGGLEGVQTGGLAVIVIYLLLAPIAGFAAGYLFFPMLLALLADATPRANQLFRNLQLVTALALAVSHGSNDGQKTIGVLVAALVSFQHSPDFREPWWVVAGVAVAMATGTAIGGRRLIRTLGSGIIRIRPVHGFAAQMPAALIVLAAGMAGGPVSATQVMASSIVGVGVAENIARVRWAVPFNIVLAWVLVLPATTLAAAALCQIIQASMGR